MEIVWHTKSDLQLWMKVRKFGVMYHNYCLELKRNKNGRTKKENQYQERWMREKNEIQNNHKKIRKKSWRKTNVRGISSWVPFSYSLIPDSYDNLIGLNIQPDPHQLNVRSFLAYSACYEGSYISGYNSCKDVYVICDADLILIPLVMQISSSKHLFYA